MSEKRGGRRAVIFNPLAPGKKASFDLISWAFDVIINPMLNASTLDGHEFQAQETGVVEKSVEASEKPQRKRAPKKQREGEKRGMKIRIMPTAEQQAQFRRWAGSSRWVWNWALFRQNDHYRSTGTSLSTDSLSRELTVMMKDEDLAWLKQVPRTCLTQTLNHLKKSWDDYFDGIKGVRPDKPGKPQFKHRGGSKESVVFQVDPRLASPVDTSDGTLKITCMGKVDAVFTQPVVGKIAAITVRQKGAHWFAALSLVDIPAHALIRKPWKTKIFPNPLDPAGLAAMDASVIRGGVVSSDGQTTWSMRDLADRARQDAKLLGKKRYQRQQSRKMAHRLREQGLDPKKPIPRGTKLHKSRRQEKLDRKIAGIDLRMLFARNDIIHKFTTELVRNHHTIVVETLMLAAMAKSLNRGFRRRMHEACMGEIIRQLKYKSKAYGRNLIFVDRWFPSSKRCSNQECHQKNTQLKLKDRAWTCPHCSTFHERDDNAAFNLWQEGWRLLREQQASTSCPSLPTVGSTGVVRRGAHARSAVVGAGEGDVPMKRKSSRKTLALPEPIAWKDQANGSVG